MKLLTHLTDTLTNLNMVSIALRLFMAVACGGLIGYERGKKKRAAGFRTHILVCLGATLAMMTNQYTFLEFGNKSSDVTRIGAQVVSGIGFLGAGTILVTKNQQIKGLTTAAGLWASACMGLAIGIGFYKGALLGCVCIFCVITAFHKIDDRVNRESIVHDIYIEFDEMKLFRQILACLRSNDCTVYTHEVFRNDIGEMGEGVGAILSFKVPSTGVNTSVISELSAIPGISFVEEL